jgi:predicted ribosome quality control (RQC) complex YloA/Tae2 family protein
MTPGFSASLNWKELDLVLSELALSGSLIQEAHQPAHDRFVLNLFRDGAHFSVLVSLSPRFPRMHVLTEKLVNPAKPMRFASFLRAHIRGGRIESAVQMRAPSPDAQEPAPDAPGQRIVRISVTRAGEQKVLWIRLWGAAANAIVTDSEGVILDAFYRRPKKGEISGKTFDPLAAVSGKPGQKGPAREYGIRELPTEGSFNERLERAFREVESSGNVEKMLAQAETELTMSENKVLASLEKLQDRLAEYANLDRYKELGDLVTSNLHLVKKGDTWLKAEDFYHDNTPVEIQLTPELNPAQNAESYYEKHRKARSGRSKVQAEIAQLEVTLKKIRKQIAAIAANPDAASLGRVAKSAARARKPLLEKGIPGLVFSSPPFRIIVGRTASENDELLRRWVRGNDWWFHARDWPGAYVFVKAQAGKTLPLETMLDAASLAVHFSKGKGSGRGDVYYTQVKYLRRAKGAKKGTVLPTQEKNLRVTLDDARMERLKEGSDAEQ